MTSTHKHTHPHANGHARGAAAANDPFPEVEKVQPGLWSIPVPLPQNSLRYVLVYLFETDRVRIWSMLVGTPTTPSARSAWA